MSLGKVVIEEKVRGRGSCFKMNVVGSSDLEIIKKGGLN